MAKFPLYHHRMNLEHVIFGEISHSYKTIKNENLDYLDAYKWLEKEVGFFPIFLAVGTTVKDILITAYQLNWQVKIADGTPDGKIKPEYVKKGEFSNRVLFSFDEVEGIFTDYEMWHLVLNSEYNNHQLTDYEKRLIFKYSWNKADWLRRARKIPSSVQLVAPKLDLRKSKRIWTRNKSTKEKLEDIGFKNVKVKRLTLGDY